MAVLQEIGPDTLIPCFSVNKSGNEDLSLCNAINTAIFNDLCHDSANESEQRMPMIVTSSTMKDHQYSSALEHFKKRLGVRKVKYSRTSLFTTTTLEKQSLEAILETEVAMHCWRARIKALVSSSTVAVSKFPIGNKRSIACPLCSF